MEMNGPRLSKSLISVQHAASEQNNLTRTESSGTAEASMSAEASYDLFEFESNSM
jgi:hypothetical protein